MRCYVRNAQEMKMSLAHEFTISRIDRYYNGPESADHISTTETLRWLVGDPRGAIEFHISRYPEEKVLKDGFLSAEFAHTRFGWLGMPGIEIHSKAPLREGQEPINICCVLGCPCYTDGTSLGASRFFESARYSMSNEMIYNHLESWHRDRFGEEPPEAPHA
jgi:hypothetical protein